METGKNSSVFLLQVNSIPTVSSVRFSSADDAHSKPSTSGKKRIRQKNYCVFCESAVTKFSRHLVRNHQNELEVQKILSKPKTSEERKRLMTVLRNKGNFMENSNTCIKPIKMPSKGFDPQNYLPCTHYYGYYSKKRLWRHKKICVQKDGAPTKSRSHQADGQTLLLSRSNCDKQLKEKVFPRMRAD